jgi:hypothetical protein
LPIWRYMDLASWLFPHNGLYAFMFFFWGAFFLVLPTWLVRPKLVPVISIAAFVLIGTLFNHSHGPLSDGPTDVANNGHCAPLTYTGLLYPIHKYLPPSHEDDLEVRNQLCWLKKMIQQVPNRFEDEREMADYMNATRDRLLMPEIKFRAALPLVAVLHGLILASIDLTNTTPNKDMESGKNFIDGLKFWTEQYTTEITAREYPSWDLPHGPYIQFEYGIIEKNWESIVDSITVE